MIKRAYKKGGINLKWASFNITGNKNETNFLKGTLV